MKSKASIYVGIAVLLCTNLARADAGWTDYTSVAELVPSARHYYTFRLPVDENPSGCRNKTWFYQNYGSPGADKMFDTLLEGVKSRIRLRVYVTGVCNLDGYSEISSISIVP